MGSPAPRGLGAGPPLKLFMCNDGSLASGDACNSTLAYPGTSIYYLFALGMNGSQHRNALFYSGQGYLHQVLNRNTWDEQSNESGWQFFRKGKVGVAVRNTNRSGALEVATLGVDYSTYSAFKAAMAGATLTDSYFLTSKGVKISDGYVDYGPEPSGRPFERLKVWEGHAGRNDERKMVDWSNQILTVSRNGLSCSYDFNSWTYSGNGCGEGGIPLPPQGDLNKDGKVDVVDLGILLSHWR